MRLCPSVRGVWMVKKGVKDGRLEKRMKLEPVIKILAIYCLYKAFGIIL
jgi:hypothetical protein